MPYGTTFPPQIDESKYLHKTGALNESADGEKTFSNGITLPYDQYQLGNDVRWLDSSGAMLASMASVGGNGLYLRAGADLTNIQILIVNIGATTAAGAVFRPEGFHGVNTYSAMAGWHAFSPSPANVALIAEGQPGQVVDLFEARLSGVTLACITQQGWLSVGPGASTYGSFPVFVAGTANRNDLVTFNTDTGGIVRYGINDSFGYLFTGSNFPLTFGTNNTVHQLTVDTNGHVYVNGSGAGLAGAQFEVHAKDDMTAIQAGYTSTNAVGYLFTPDGRLIVGGSTDQFKTIMGTHSTNPSLGLYCTSQGAVHSWFVETGANTFLNVNPIVHRATSHTFSNVAQDTNWLAIDTGGHVIVGNQGTAGLSDAQLESHAKDNLTPIFAGYTSTGGTASVQILPDGTISCKPLTTNSPGITFYANNYGLGVDSANLTIFSSLGFAFKNSSVTGTQLAIINNAGQMAIGNGGLFGLSNAQLEVTAKDSSTPIFAGYTSTGQVWLTVDPRLSKIQGCLMTDGAASNDVAGLIVDTGGFYRVGLMKSPGETGILMAGNNTPIQIGHRTDSDNLTDTWTGFPSMAMPKKIDLKIDPNGTVTIGNGTGPTSTDGLLVNYGGNSTITSQGSANPAVMALSTDQNITTKIQSISSILAGVVGTQSNHALWLETNNTARVRIDADGTVTILTELVLPQSAESAIPNGGAAWSTDNPGHLMARKPDGTLKEIQLL